MCISALPKIVLACGFEMLPKSLQEIILHPVLCILECLSFVSVKNLTNYRVPFSNALYRCNCVAEQCLFTAFDPAFYRLGQKLNSCI